jgi:cytochrome c peroxidase
MKTVLAGNKRRSIAAGVLAAALIAGAAVHVRATDQPVAPTAPGARQVAAVPAQDAMLVELKALYKRPETIPFPAGNPYTPKKVALGKLLYFDTRLSGSNLLSCASCHNPGYGWSDGLAKGVGNGMNQLPRRTPTILNAAWGSIYFWDGRAPSLEAQALGPIQSTGEMNMPLEQLVGRISGVEGYRKLFAEAFPGQEITAERIAEAIATFERTVVASRAPFDDWIDGDESAIPEAAKRGFLVFNTTGNCATCHTGWNFTDDSFHDIGLPDGDIGRGKQLPEVEKMHHAFKTPGLRDLARRAPYMHDGSLKTLVDVVDHYRSGGTARPSLSDDIKPVALTEQERADLIAFLDTLTGDLAPVVLPVLPR